MPKQTFFNLPEVKRQAIINIAIEEFAENDYQAGSISRIVARAGIAKGSFYQYFEDKKDLYLYLLDLSAQQKKEFLDQTPPPDPQMGTFDYLRWLFSAAVQFEFSNPRLSSVAYRAYYGNTPFLEEMRGQAKQAMGEFVEQLIRQGIENGDLDPKLDVEAAVFIFNVIFMELGNHILKRLNIPPSELDRMGAVLFDSPDAKCIFNKYIDILEYGMARRKEVAE